MRFVRTCIRLGIVALALVVVLAAVLVATHRPDKDAYVEYVATHGNYDNLKVRPVTRSELVAGGNRTCDWLRDRPMALWRTERKWTVNSLYTEYERTLPKVDALLPKSFLPGAFTYLCPLSTYMRKPHRLLARSASD